MNELYLHIFIVSLPVVFAMLYGVATAVMDLNKFHTTGEYSKLYQWYKDELDWWIGGKQFNPQNPFTSDAWHLAKHFQQWCVSAMVLSAMLVALLYPSPWLVLYGLLPIVISLSFLFFYHYQFRTNVSFAEFIKEVKTFN